MKFFAGTACLIGVIWIGCMGFPSLSLASVGERGVAVSILLPLAADNTHEASRQTRERLNQATGILGSLRQAIADFTGSVEKVFDYEGGYNDQVFFSGVLYLFLVLVLLFFLKLAYNILKGVFIKARYQVIGDSAITERYRIPWFRKNKTAEEVKAKKEGKKHLRKLIDQ